MPALDLYAFTIRAEPDPQALMRIAGLFAQRSIVPEQICCRRSGEGLVVDIDVRLDSAGLAGRLLEKLRTIVVVGQAELREREVA